MGVARKFLPLSYVATPILVRDLLCSRCNISVRDLLCSRCNEKFYFRRHLLLCSLSDIIANDVSQEDDKVR